MPRLGHVHIGISGWRYPRWRGGFYPEGLRQADELRYAARSFGAIEINGSFYRLQRPESYRRWCRATPPGFTFAVKGPRFVTHIKRLVDIERALANFFASGVLALGSRLGPILWQLPPNLAFEAVRMREFLALLPRDTHAALALARRRDVARMRGRTALPRLPRRRLRHALEVRHPSFADAAFSRLLRRHGVALVVADTAGRWPYLEEVTADFVYLRLHGASELYASGYDAAALDDWARRIRAWRRGAQPAGARRLERRRLARRPRDVYCFFDNDAKTRAPFDAYALSERLRVASGHPPGRPAATT